MTGSHSGPLTKSITVTTNVEGVDSTIMLQIKGELWQIIEVSPLSAAFGRLNIDSQDKAALVRKLTIVNNSEAPMTLTKITSNNPMVKAEATPLVPGKKYEMTVSMIPPLKPGAFYGMISANTGVPEMASLNVSVNAYVASDLEVTPNSITLPTGRSTVLQRQLYIRSNTTTPAKISDLQTSNPELKTELRETQPGQSWLVTINFPAAYKVAPGGDKITFKTDRPAMPLVTVPITEINTAALLSPTPPKGADPTKPQIPPGTVLSPGSSPPTVGANANGVPVTPAPVKPQLPANAKSGH
jgi:hypothetical protein